MAPGSIPSCCLTSEQKDALIDAVRQRAVIWDCSLDAYQEVQNRRAAFVDVAELLSDEKSKYTGPEMQVEWKKLRDIFNRTLKKVVASGGSDSEVTWRYWTKLQFIADHERSQISKARKWCKKEPSSPPSSSSVARHRSRRSSTTDQRTPTAPQTDDPSVSLVQQLTEVAQSARELLKIEDFNDASRNGEEHLLADVSEGVKLEENREESGGDGECGDGEESIGEALGQIFMLSKQIAENGGVGGVPANVGFKNQNNIGNGTHQEQMPESDLPIRFLLNEWMTKGGPNSTNVAGEAEAVFSGLNDNNSHRLRHHPSPPAPKRMRWPEENGTGGGSRGATAAGHRQSQQQQNVGDQFDIFGMFIASQVRTLSMHSSQSALRLKRSLTELCFQFEAQENNDRGRRTTPYASRNSDF
uniref:MADF domain-containing protein n=2 Tax=Globodera pallida TaxID=36090 RepID=A0A183CNQ9_GLOPA